MEAMESAIPPILNAGIALWGLIDCLFGYRVFRLTVALLGLTGGAIAGALLGYFLFPEPIWVPVVLAVISALIGGAVAWILLRLGLALLAGITGAFVASSLLAPPEGAIYWVTVCLVAIISAGLAVLLVRPAIVILTAFTGAFRCVIGGGFFIGRPGFHEASDDLNRWTDSIGTDSEILVAIIVLAGLGALFQVFSERRRKQT